MVSESKLEKVEASESKWGGLRQVRVLQFGQVMVIDKADESRSRNFIIRQINFLEHTRLGGNWSSSSIVNISVFSKHIDDE